MKWGIVLAAATMIAATAPTVSTAQTTTEAAPSRAKVECAWSGLNDAQRRYMILNGGSRETNTSITLFMPGLPPDLDIPTLATSCGVATDDAITLAMGLRWRSKEEAAREAIVKVGRDPVVVDTALTYLNRARREQMGDAMSCPGSVQISQDWDRSVGIAIQRTRIRTTIGASYSLTALAIYARAAQEGAERRLNGRARPCPEA